MDIHCECILAIASVNSLTYQKVWESGDAIVLLEVAVCVSVVVSSGP